MAWIVPTEADLVTKITGDELEAYRAAALAAGQVDPVAPSMTAAVNLVRGYVGGCQRNTLGPEGTIPDELLVPFLDILVAYIVARVPKQSLGRVRELARDDAVKLLSDDVAECKFAIEDPETEDDGAAGGTPSPSITDRSKKFSRADQDGV